MPEGSIAKILLPRAWYSSSIPEFVAADPSAVLGKLTANAEYDAKQEQVHTWQRDIPCLQEALDGVEGTVFLEFTIPRIGDRIDAVVISGAAVLALEFKSNPHPTRGDINKAWDYCLDLKFFHKASHRLALVPVLVAPFSCRPGLVQLQPAPDGVYRPILTSRVAMAETIGTVLAAVSGDPVDAREWCSAPYEPTPTIVDAARALFANHSVEEIASSEACGENLRRTSDRVISLVSDARAQRQKTICFVTGVPGAGKTLVGLDVAARPVGDGSHAVFMSGNGPLVAVLQGALKRDQRHSREGRRGTQVAEKSVEKLIQNVHQLRDEGLKNPGPPSEQMVIFDEAQRAWDLKKTENFMRRRKGIENFGRSEPQFLIECMDRHKEWAFIACLVGNGQEIHQGEAGIGAWFEALRDFFPEWKVCVSPEMLTVGHGFEPVLGQLKNVQFDEALHLAVSARSFRAENVSSFVDALIKLDDARARLEFKSLRARYPIAITRNLGAAKDWLREHIRGTQRAGLVATSRAMRLRPYAIDVRVAIDPVHWFLDAADDLRSSCFLEDVATEFQVQGLELDWVCLNWDADLRMSHGAWRHHDFRGTVWNRVHNAWHRIYIENAYRVLLTRARQGFVVFVPEGDANDPTRVPAFYDSVYDYFRGLGIPNI